MRRLAVATEDFALYHDLLAALQRRGLDARTLRPGAPVPADVGVVLTGWKDVAAGRVGRTATSETGRSVPVVSVPLGPDGKEDCEAALNEAQKALAGVTQYRVVTVGVDPGDRPGLAAVGDGALLQTTQLESPAQVVDAARRAIHQYPAERHVVRIGHGARLVRNRILNDLLALRGMGADVEIVDETATNPSPHAGRRQVSDVESRHVQAALRIALARGVRVDRPQPIEPSEGEIADLQRVSRVASEGRVTISAERARRVARGLTTLARAIEEQEGHAAPARPLPAAPRPARSEGRGAREPGRGTRPGRPPSNERRDDAREGPSRTATTKKPKEKQKAKGKGKEKRGNENR